MESITFVTKPEELHAMTYDDTIDFLYSNLPAYHRIGKLAYKGNLDNTIALDEYFGHPHKKFKSIHIAGTNGKGSVSHMMASLLQEGGYRTALYTSPHLKDFRERIRVDGIMIPQEEVVAFVEQHRGIMESLKPSFFELTMAMAFDWFARSEVDLAVVETGLGGRLDSTNIVTPILSVITNIGLEHTNFLGDTYDKIAWEKAGIIKSRVPVVIGEGHKSTTPVFIEKANSTASEIFWADRNFCCEWLDDEMQPDSSNGETRIVTDKNSLGYRRYRITKYKIGEKGSLQFDSNDCNKREAEWVHEGLSALYGDYQLKNLQTLFQSFNVVQQELGLKWHDISAGVANVIKNTGFLGRWQVLSRCPLTICDTGHNRDGLVYTIKQLQGIEKRRLHCVLGFSADKDIEMILSLFPNDAIYYFTKAANERAIEEEPLKNKAAKLGLVGEAYHSVSDGYAAARRDADEEDLIFIGGSIFVVAEIL